MNPDSLVRSLIRDLHAYVPGEQPAVKGLIKLNTNENPYPPAPGVRKVIKDAADERLRLYPNPTAQRLREKLARFHSCSPENIIVGNGSDELLALAVRVFVQPASSKRTRSSIVQYFEPSYSLYPVLADTHDALKNPVRLRPDFDLPAVADLPSRGWDFSAALSFVTTPNAPSGRAYSNSSLRQLCRRQVGAIVLDEAYVDFAEENALKLALHFPNILVARTFSKAYSLCFLRVGYFVGHPVLIAAMHRMRDSYNVNGLGQLAAEATLNHLSYYRRNFKRIRTTRSRLTRALAEIGFSVLPSQTNFILAKPPALLAQDWLEALRQRKILVRWFSQPPVRDYLRITVGSDDQANKLIAAAQGILRSLR